MTNPDCFHWTDTNDDDPPYNVEVIGMWIDTNGTTSTLPVVYEDDPHDHGRAPAWTYDGVSCRPPHAWCANLSAHHLAPLNTPPQGDTQTVNTSENVPKWVHGIAATILVTLSMAVGIVFGAGIGAGLASTNEPLATILLIALTVGVWTPTVARAVRRRKERARGQVQTPTSTD